MASQHLTDYRDFEIGEDKPWEGYTKFPIYYKFNGRILGWCETVEAARREVDEYLNDMPDEPPNINER